VEKFGFVLCCTDKTDNGASQLPVKVSFGKKHRELPEDVMHHLGVINRE